MLVTSLSQGRKCLVVSKKVPVLKEVQKGIEEIGLSKWCFLWASRNSFELFNQHLKSSILNNNQGLKIDQNAFKKLESKLFQLSSLLDNKYSGSRKKVLGELTWSDLVGQFLIANKEEDKALLFAHLDPGEFSFDLKEFNSIVEPVKQSQSLFGKVKTINHPLRDLNAGIFVHKSESDALSFIQESIDGLLDKGRQLLRSFIAVQNEYAENLTGHYQKIYNRNKKLLEGLKSKLQELNSLYNRDLRSSSKFTLQLFGSFNTKAKEVLHFRKQLSDQYLALQKLNTEGALFHHTFLKETDFQFTDRVSSNLKQYSNLLNNWHHKAILNVQEENLRLNSKTALAELGFKEKISDLEVSRLELFVEELNAIGLYQLPLESKTLTLSKQQKFLELCIDKLENTKLNLRDFNGFYQWQKFWFSLPCPG